MNNRYLIGLSRDKYWDSLKFFLIFLVVYGHCIEAYSPEGSINRAIYNLIYTFHMPLFIFVSGRFSQIRDKEKYKKGILKILETYIVFHVVWRLISLVSGKELNTQFLLNCFVLPSWSLWYLVSIIWWRLIVLGIPEKIRNEKPLLILFTTFFIGIVGGVIPVNSHFSMQRTMAYMPFFFMGYYSVRIDTRGCVNKIPIYLPIIVIVAGFLFYYFYLNENINFILTCRKSYWVKPEIPLVVKCVARCLLFLSAAILSIMALRIVPSNNLFAKWGANTLFVYMFHSFFIKAFRLAAKKGFIPDFITQNEIILLLLSISLCVGLFILSHTKFSNLLLSPISSLSKK